MNQGRNEKACERKDKRGRKSRRMKEACGLWRKEEERDIRGECRSEERENE